jgi:sulfur transfer protein SufE
MSFGLNNFNENFKVQSSKIHECELEVYIYIQEKWMKEDTTV